MCYVKDTIAAIATPYAQGGIGIIRISGAEAKSIAKKIFKPAKANFNISNLAGYCGLFGHVVYNNKVIDEAIFLNFNAPKSYTGEDVVEISVHSGLFILKEVLRAVLNSGARLAQPGEFTKRAFLNQKITLTEAEAVVELISANNEQAHHAALELKQGKLFKFSQTIANELLSVISHVAAFIDYPEEEVADVDLKQLDEQISSVYSKLCELLKTYDFGKIIKEGIATVIVGKPNVGKSTIMNLLSGFNRSIVTSVPGTTRDIIEESIVIDGIMLKIADTAGLRKTEDLVENIGVQLAEKQLEQSDLVLAVFDASKPLENYDYELFDKITNKNVIGIINKTDLSRKIDSELIKSKIGLVIEGSAQSNELLSKLAAAIKSKTEINLDCNCILANERQRDCIKRAAEQLEEARTLIAQKQTLDIISVCLEDALHFLFELEGKEVSDAVIDDVFAKFCVGK